ncbi:MAG: hypothetical protein ACT4P6_14145 [Gemmatimonadaceae bacterium]
MTAPFRAFGPALSARVRPASGVETTGAAPPAEAPPAAPQPPAGVSAPATAPTAPPSSPPGMLSPAALRGATLHTAANLGAFRPELLDRVRPNLPLPPAPPEQPAADKTFTQLVNDAIGQLRAAPRETLGEAVRTLQAKNIRSGEEIMSLIERRTRVGEVLGGSAARWSAETVADFAALFQMEATKLAVMDAIVAIGVLNDAEFEAELRMENLPPTTPQDLLQNRKIVFQYPPPGTELTPPYVILVAVEHQDFAQAEQIIASLLGQLVPAQGFRMPRDAAARLG